MVVRVSLRLLVVASLAACAAASKGNGAGVKDLATPPDQSLTDGTQGGDDGGGTGGDLATVDGPVADLAQPKPDLTGYMCTPTTMPCDLVCQNCMSGYKCSLNGMQMPACAVAGPVAADTRCNTMGTGDDCVAGDICIVEAPTQNIDKCHVFCRQDSDCTNGGRCSLTISNTSIKICSEKITNCNPQAQTGCSGGLGCYPVTPTGLTGCHEVGTMDQGGACKTDYDCKGGWSCFNFGSGQACYQICDMTKMASCPTGLKCYQLLNGQMMPAWTDNPNFGVCAM